MIVSSAVDGDGFGCSRIKSYRLTRCQFFLSYVSFYLVYYFTLYNFLVKFVFVFVYLVHFSLHVIKIFQLYFLLQFYVYFANLPVKQAVCLESTALGCYLDVVKSIILQCFHSTYFGLINLNNSYNCLSMIVHLFFLHLHRNLLQEAKLRLYLYQIHVFSKKLRLKKMELFLRLTFIHFLQELIWENLVKDQIIFLQGSFKNLSSLLHIDILCRKLKLVTKISFLRKRPRTQTAISLLSARKSMSKCNMQVCESSELCGQKQRLLWFHTAFLEPVHNSGNGKY